ncbi:MAG: hypothetical protein H0U82_06315 [Actinobacteria bacterium]|nr:hypothetical protein [Actinomycetota bacterium]
MVGDGCEIGRRRPLSGLVRRRDGQFGVLGAEVFQARLKPREPFVAALGGELALLEGLVVALERLLGADDLGADRGDPLLDLGSSAGSQPRSEPRSAPQ